MDSFKHLSTFLSSAFVSYCLLRLVSKRMDNQETVAEEHQISLNHLSRQVSTLHENKYEVDDILVKLQQDHTKLEKQVRNLEDRITEMEQDLFQHSPQGQHVATLESSSLSF